MRVMLKEQLHVRIISPRGLRWEGSAESLAGHNRLGPFSILPRHAHLVSIISGQITVAPVGTTPQQFVVGEHGVLFCRNNRVHVFIELPLGQEQLPWWMRARRAPADA